MLHMNGNPYILHPRLPGRRFGEFPGNDWENLGIPTAAQSYCDGYQTGITWKDTYRPGGPHVTSIGHVHRNNPDWIAFCEATAENNREWKRGFDDARAKREPNWMGDVDKVAVLGYN